MQRMRTRSIEEPRATLQLEAMFQRNHSQSLFNSCSDSRTTAHNPREQATQTISNVRRERTNLQFFVTVFR